jgi:hypothetical protein
MKTMKRHTTTSIARLAASREVLGIYDKELRTNEDDPGDLRFGMSGVTLENLQGPIPELSFETPDWLEVYRAVKIAPPPSRKATERDLRAEKRAPRHSPYAQRLDNRVDSRANSASPPRAAVAFNEVYGRKNSADGEFAAALLSLTSHGAPVRSEATEAPTSAPTNPPIISKFPTKERRERGHRAGGETGHFVSGGQG